MPLLITKMTLDTAKLLSLVDAGASGDEDTRPEIVLFKRRQKTMDLNEDQRIEVAKIMKQVALAKMGVSAVVAALDEMGLKPEQRDGVLKLMEAMMGAPDAEQEQKAEPEAPAEEPAEKMDPAKEEDMAKRAEDKRAEAIAKLEKRHADEKAELNKRVKTLEEAAEQVTLEKRAAELEFLPLSKSETVDLLKRIGDHEAGQAMLTRLAKMCKESPILQVAGVEGSNESSAQVTLNKRIKTMRDADPSISNAKAKAAIFKADPELFAAVKAEAGN